MIAHRRWCLLAFALVTLFFALGLPRVQLKTVFSDLLPRDDPFVQVFKDHPNFGNPLTLMIMVQHRHGSIYNAETIDLVWQLTRDIDLAPAVDHAQVISITTEKARYSEATPYGVDMRPLMNDTPPRTAQEIAQFRARVDKSPNTKTFLISRDETATLVMATFIEHQLDYAETFEYVQGLVEAARSDQHAVYLTGQPALVGWVYRHQVELTWIFALTIGVLILALAVSGSSAGWISRSSRCSWSCRCCWSRARFRIACSSSNATASCWLSRAIASWLLPRRWRAWPNLRCCRF